MYSKQKNKNIFAELKGINILIFISLITYKIEYFYICLYVI